MKINSKPAVVVGCLAVNMFFAQQHQFLSPPPFDEADLRKTNSLVDKNAPAEILYNSVRYNIMNDASAENEYYSKIKIYDKKRAEEWLNVNIPVQTGESLGKFEVRIYNLSNNKVEKLVIDKKEQLKENFTKGVRIYKLALPSVSDGSIIEYSYKISSKNLINPNYFLEYSIPVVYQEYNLEYPDEAITYAFNTTGKIIKPKYQLSTTESHLGALYNVFRFGYENIKPIQKEKYVKDLDRFRGKIKPELRRYSNQYFAYNNFKDWNKVAETLDNYDEFGGFLKSNVKDILPQNIKTYFDPLERANKIFNFVKENYKWNRSYGIIASQSLKQLLKTKAGNSADINLLLTMLLRDAGIEANPLLISTVDNGILNITLPNINTLNFLFTSAKINNQIYFYDATSFNSKANLLPERNWNDFGILIEDKKGASFSFSNLTMSKKELSIKARLDLENPSVKGTFVQKDNGMYAIESYEDFDMNKEKYKESFLALYNIEGKNVESKLLPDGDFETQVAFANTNLMDVIGNKVIINPMMFLNAEKESFDQTEERMHQIDFTSAFTKEKRVELEIPDHYKVLSLPKDKKIATDDGEISFNYKVETLGNTLIITSKIKVASQNYPKGYYPFFKQIWKTISETENQVISLEKN
ncbi:MAG TPA: transglutaminase [Chryseobacterium sp.]|nr:transglutaminase [Chryseobacterium sp.]